MNIVIYFSFLFSVLIISLFYSLVQNKVLKDVFIFLTFIIISAFFALRFDVGPDYHNYVLYFKDVTTGIFNLPRTDYLALLFLSQIFSFSEFGFIFFFAFYSSISVMLIILAIRDRFITPSLFFFLTYGFLFMGFDRIRQFLALTIFIYAFKDVLNNRFKSYCFKIFIASFFHVSAIFLLPIYFLSKIKIHGYVMISSFMLLFTGFYFNVWQDFISEIYNYIPYYTHIYANTKHTEVHHFNSGVGLFGRALICLIILIFGNFHQKYKTTIFIGLVLLIFGAGNLNATRIADYYLAILIPAFPLFMTNVVTKKFTYVSTRIFVTLSLLILFAKEIDRPYYNYQTVFSESFKKKIFQFRSH